MTFPTAALARGLQGSGSMPRRTNSGGGAPRWCRIQALTPSA